MTSTCDRPGCTGTIAPDGYCDECGHKASATQPASVAQPPASVAQPPVSVATSAYGGLTVAGLGRTTGSGRVTGTRTGTGGRGRLGASLVVVPPVPLRDPTTAVMVDPQVPESQRYCGKCGEPVGRGRAGKPGRVDGFCPKDRTPFSFRPRLSPGELVDDRYEILGALAHGGLGWIYLARDRNISESGADRWVVLKGLISTGDADAMASAMAERRFLVEVDHPNIVKIHDIAQHTDAKTGEVVAYIVMEYVGGRSLKDLALSSKGPDGRRAPLPLDHVLAYGIEVLPALGYLHDRGLLFCDFKPDNVIHAEEQLKLIDLGAVRRADDHDSALWGTPGYQAPELAKQARRSPPTSTPLAGLWPCSALTSAASPPGTPPACPTRGTWSCSPGRSPTTGCCCGRRTSSPSAGSAPPVSWPSRRSGCSGRCSRWPMACHVRRPRCTSRPSGPRSGPTPGRIWTDRWWQPGSRCP